jgi:pimeloyl-ACP methyl ester carboxylesterase
MIRSFYRRLIFKTILPVIFVFCIGTGGLTAWVVYRVTNSPERNYLVTPPEFIRLSERGVKASDETWTNKDNTKARGWLLRGTPGHPGVILLHHYGADRSWLLNLGVMLNETTDFTVLFPDMRGHGEEPNVSWTSFGTHEAADVSSAIDYLKELKTKDGQQLVGSSVGLYGVELGGYSAMRAVNNHPDVRTLILDSIPASPDDLITAELVRRTGIELAPMKFLARFGIRFYLGKNYSNVPTCEIASRIHGKQIYLLTGPDAGTLKDSTIALAKCFPPSSNVDLQGNLPTTGFNVASVTGEQGEAYDRRVIEFLNRTLREEQSKEEASLR